MAKRSFTPLIDVESTPLLDSYKEIKLKYCEVSNKVYLNKRWVKYSSDIIARLLKEALVFEKFVEITAVDIELSEDPLEETEAMAFVSAVKQGLDVHQEFPLTYRIIREESPMVSKEKSGQYYQGIFQLIEGTEAAKVKAQQLIDQAHKRGIFMNKFVETPAQCDYYLSDNHFLQQLAKKMQKLFGGNINTTSTLHTFDHLTSREMHRVTVTLFCFRFQKHELLEKSGDVYFVEAIQKEAKIRHLITNEKMAIGAKEAREYRVLKRTPVTICQTQPIITAIHPQTFQEEEIISINNEPLPTAGPIDVYVVAEKLYYAS